MENRQDLEKTELGIKSILTLVGVVIGFVGFFYSQVIIPIKEIQIQLISIQKDISNFNVRIQKVEDKFNNKTTLSSVNSKVE